LPVGLHSEEDGQLQQQFEPHQRGVEERLYRAFRDKQKPDHRVPDEAQLQAQANGAVQYLQQVLEGHIQ